ncbi:phosphatidate cytidylyltransferase [Hymenobacter persicinus]|uniref:Phosphatidate cytidylyltransferase n=1 Tax=Hymenobacter persicinus TaxID=2025506 RepID=A0A4Q5LAV9_9BACT|nr:phosphatidate cytidylyltransferase [Hymenobacter persicinus]RYU75813.1 phosphatidate cytidylyltransferase [Hymenobacter persicinus]
MPVSATPATPPVPDQPTEDKKPMSNLAQRVIFGVIGAALLLGSVWYGAWTFALFFAAVQAKMLLEYYRMMQKAGYKPAAILGVSLSLVFFAGIFCLNAGVGATIYPPLVPAPTSAEAHFPQGTLIADVLIALGLLLPVLLILREMYSWPRENKELTPFANVGVALLGLLYVSLPMSLLSVIAFGGSGPYDYRRIFALLFLVWCSDIGAYAAGKTFGRHKLAPSISPGKTWEGAVGGFVLTLVMGWALGYFLLPELSLTYRLVAAGAVAVFGPLGDLAESMLKRSVGVKDSGTIMPGHGGLLDRFDAFLFILPVLALLQLLLG